MDPLGIVGSALLSHREKRTEKKTIRNKGLSTSSFRKKMKEGTQAKIFSELSASGFSRNEEPEVLLDAVYQLGEELKRKKTTDALGKYRQAVRQFYQLIVSRSLDIEKVEGRLNLARGNRKQYTLIRIVDEKLEKLGAAVLRNQKDQLDILGKIDEIHGILIDMLG